METYYAWFALLGMVLVLGLMRWSFQDWRKAILAALCAPVAIGFLWLVGFVAVAVLLRFLNALLVAFGVQVPSAVFGIAAASISSAMVIALLVWFCRDQRAQSTMKEGSKFGVPYPVAPPSVFRKRF